ncbi:hypothetical protein B0T17DRAFT_245690 [Bombardia bombarda]|uniref:Uncharacterized protein n=1 Tax=Bombardia bombarda TaxID=252184 RepID=A0AA40C514_9PEZI|nr:hypothetical protein B0T17DRAFT_245690 [Bombardia bombarda]
MNTDPVGIMNGIRSDDAMRDVLSYIMSHWVPLPDAAQANSSFSSQASQASQANGGLQGIHVASCPLEPAHVQGMPAFDPNAHMNVDLVDFSAMFPQAQAQAQTVGQSNMSFSPPLFIPPLPLKPNPKLARDGWTQEQDNLLLTLRQAGWAYSDISDAMRTQLGADISVNRLVKRFDKIRELYLDPLLEAVKNVMPEIMACIKDEMGKMDLGALPQTDKQLLDEIVEELPRSIPKFVQNRLLRKRKAMLSTPGYNPSAQGL